MPTRKQAIIVTGGRKTANARAIVRPGTGIIRINKIALESYTPEIARMKIMEPVLVTGDLRKQIDIDVSVSGGGFIGQAEAVRTSIARGIANWFKTVKVKRAMAEYDRVMLAGDARQKEMKKFGGWGARRRKQKSYR